MTAEMSAALAGLVVLGVTAAATLLILRFWPALRRDRFETAAAPASRGASILRFDDRLAPSWRKTLERIGRAVQPKDLVKLARSRARLTWAGYHDPKAVALFWGVKLGAALIGFVAYPAFGALTNRVMPTTLPYSLALFGLGFFLPDLLLRRRIAARQRDIVNTLPDALDLLMVCVESGLGFDAAVARVSDQPDIGDRPLYQEMYRMHLEIRAGRPREEALRALGERTGVEEVKAMVAAFIQSDRLGTPLGTTLRIHAEFARVQRRHRAETQAYLAPLKMIFPTVLFLMPAFFLVSMAPSLLGLMVAFKSLGQ